MAEGGREDKLARCPREVAGRNSVWQETEGKRVPMPMCWRVVDEEEEGNEEGGKMSRPMLLRTGAESRRLSQEVQSASPSARFMVKAWTYSRRGGTQRKEENEGKGAWFRFDGIEGAGGRNGRRDDSKRECKQSEACETGTLPIPALPLPSHPHRHEHRWKAQKITQRHRRRAILDSPSRQRKRGTFRRCSPSSLLPSCLPLLLLLLQRRLD